MQILARCIVIQDLYFVGRKTAMKLSKASAKTIPKEMLSESNENEEPTLAISSDCFRPKKSLYSSAAKIGATTIPVKTFAADIVSTSNDEGLRKDCSGSTIPVTTRRPLPITVTGDKIILYTAKISSSGPAELKVPFKPSLTLVKFDAFMKSVSMFQCQVFANLEKSTLGKN